MGAPSYRTATWVAQLSRWKFFLFSILVLNAGAIMEDTLFQPDSKLVIIKKISDGRKSSVISDGDADIRIDGSGIHIRKSTPGKRESDGTAEDAAASTDDSTTSVTNAITCGISFDDTGSIMKCGP